MLSSMTGFVSKTIDLTTTEEKPVHLTINIKTLNSRFFEATCRLSHALSNLETDLLKVAKEKLSRGHMYLNMTLSDPNAFNRLIGDTNGIYTFLECNQFDSSVTHSKRIIIQPDQKVTYTLDRAEGTKYVAIGGGYYNVGKDE